MPFLSVSIGRRRSLSAAAQARTVQPHAAVAVFFIAGDGATVRAMDQILIALAGLMGAAGVILTAAGAHGKPGAGLDSAGTLLLLNALAVMGGVLLVRQGVILRPLGLVVLWGFVLGAALFAGDVAARAYLGGRLFPFAAPTGGLVMIASWLALAAAALLALRG
jgi:uncharacterized membrane protein YgdD (TMEM256/DUF423 family)